MDQDLLYRFLHFIDRAKNFGQRETTLTGLNTTVAAGGSQASVAFHKRNVLNNANMVSNKHC